MKNKVLGLWVLGILVLGMTASQSFAMSDSVITAKIPFAFMVQGKTLPAGQYRIERVWSSDSYIYLIRNRVNRRTETIFSSNAAETTVPPTQTELVFDRIGNHYFLRQLWSLGDDIGREVPEARFEKKISNAGLTVTHQSVPARS